MIYTGKCTPPSGAFSRGQQPFKTAIYSFNSPRINIGRLGTHTSSLTPWSRTPLVKLTIVPQLHKKFPKSFENQRLPATYQSSTPTRSLSARNILILSSIPPPLLPSALFPIHFLTKTLYIPLLSSPPYVSHTPTHSFLEDTF